MDNKIEFSLQTLVVSCRNGALESLNPAVATIKDFKVLGTF